MKRFFFSLAVFVVLFVIADKCIGIYYNHLDRQLLSYPIDYQTVYTQMAWSLDDDVFVIGSSEARHHYDVNRIQDSIGFTVMNVGKDGSQLYLQASTLQNMLKRHVPKLIIWELSPLCLALSDEDMDRLSQLSPFYDEDTLCRSLINQRGWEEKYKMLSHSYRNNGRLLGLLEVKYSGAKDDGLKGYVPAKNVEGKYPSRQVKKYESKTSLQCEALLMETITKAQQLGSKIIVVTSPKLSQTNLTYTVQYKRFSKICDSLNVRWLNYLEDEHIVNDSTCFKDAFHLNEKGVDKYMELFIPELKEFIDETNVR